MKKPKQRKAGQPPKLPQKPPQQNPQTPLPKQALGTWWGKLVALLALFGAIQGVVSTFDFFRSIYRDTQPEIELAGESKQPFELPLIVRNKSHFFAMTDIDWRCMMENAKSEAGPQFSNLSIAWQNSPKTIDTEGSQIFPCNLFNGGAKSATIVPIISYKTLGVKRTYARRRFTWFGSSDPPRWVASDTQQ